MKIASWNANCKYREKYTELEKFEADVYVVMECENPATSKDAAYRERFKSAIWVGQYDYKGLMVYTTNPYLNLVRLEWEGSEYRYFLPVRVCDSYNLLDSFTLVGAWACDPYCEELQDWVETVYPRIDQHTIIIGDLNSNVSLDPKHIRASGKSFGKVLELLKPKGLEGIWHHYKKEVHGKENTPTFFLYRHLDKPLHLDHCLASPNFVKSMQIHARWQWLSLSDHLPIEIEVKSK